MKVVYGNKYFVPEAISELPSQIGEAYRKALERLPESFRHNLVKVEKDCISVTLLWYPHLDTHAHPYLEDSLLIPLDGSLPTKYRKESKKNPVILHRLETMLVADDPRRALLAQLTEEEEQAGLFSKQHSPFIGRRKYWNAQCRKLGMLRSLAPEDEVPYVQLEFFDELRTPVSVKREATAIARARPSAPTRWAMEQGFIVPVVVDWGCGKGRDTKWLRDLGIDVIPYDPFYHPNPSPDEIDFSRVNSILLNYVLNVIESIEERWSVLKKIHLFAKAETVVIVSARSAREIEQKAKQGGWRKLNDGYITGRNTFQKGFALEELVSSCSVLGSISETTKFHGGVACVVSITK